MKYKDLNNYIEDNGLLKTNVKSAPGIYVITIDGYVAAIRDSFHNVRQDCGQVLYEMENAVLTQRYEYLLLYAAKIGGHDIDCVGLEYLPKEQLTKRRIALQQLYEPFLDKFRYSENPYAFKIEDLIHSLKYTITQKEIE